MSLPSSRDESIQLSVFSLGLIRFGVPLIQTQEFIRSVAVSPLPKAPDVIEGIIDLRGRVIPIVNLRARFQLPSRKINLTDYFVIVLAAERVVGLRVDAAQGLTGVPRQQIDDIDNISSKADHLAGVARLSDGLLYVHDLDKLLADAEGEQLDAALKEQGNPSERDG